MNYEVKTNTSKEFDVKFSDGKFVYEIANGSGNGSAYRFYILTKNTNMQIGKSTRILYDLIDELEEFFNQRITTE